MLSCRSMGIAGVRSTNNMKFFEEKKPLCVVYYDIDYTLNPKGITILHALVVVTFSALTFRIKLLAQ